MKHDHYYIEGGIIYRVVGINDGFVALRNTSNGKLRVLSELSISTMNFVEVPKPKTEYVGMAQIRGGEIQDRTIT